MMPIGQGERRGALPLDGDDCLCALFPFGYWARGHVMVANYSDLKLYIAGEWRQADGQPVINPADESTLATVPRASRAVLDDALGAAEQGFKTWSRTAPAKRAEIILKAVQLMRERVEAMAIAM
jgi:succinate-semialdehyde dehydrogenase/glutarate-semialdehyde dehydrogenase